jgi:hypothetical protein
MATFRTSVAAGNATNANVSVSITPVVGDLFVVFVAETAGDDTMTVADDNGGTYTKTDSSANSAGSAHGAVFIRDQLLLNTTSTSVTLTKSVAPTSTGHEIVVVAVTGSNTSGSGARRQGATVNGASGVATTTFGVAALTGNLTLVGLTDLTNPPGLTAPTSWTNRQNVGQTTPLGLIVATRDSGFTGTAITWGTNPATSFASIAIELTQSIQDGTAYAAVDFPPNEVGGVVRRGDLVGGTSNYFYPAHNGGWSYNFIAGSLPPLAARPEMLEVTQNVAVKVPVKMRSSVTGQPLAGLTLVIKLRKAGETVFTVITPTYVDATNGSYELALLAAHVNTSGCAELLITAAGALPNTDTILNVISLNKNDVVRAGLTALPTSVFGTVGGLPLLDANLDISANVTHWLGVAPNAAVAAAVLDALRSGHVVPGSIGEGIAIAAGLLQGNFFMDNITNTANGQTAARMRVFHTGAAAAAATAGGVGQGEFATFLVETAYTGPNKIQTHRVVQQ